MRAAASAEFIALRFSRGYLTPSSRANSREAAEPILTRRPRCRTRSPDCVFGAIRASCVLETLSDRNAVQVISSHGFSRKGAERSSRESAPSDSTRSREAILTRRPRCRTRSPDHVFGIIRASYVLATLSERNTARPSHRTDSHAKGAGRSAREPRGAIPREAAKRSSREGPRCRTRSPDCVSESSERFTSWRL